MILTYTTIGQLMVKNLIQAIEGVIVYRTLVFIPVSGVRYALGGQECGAGGECQCGGECECGK